MRVFLFISKSGDSLPLAQRVVEEGNRALFYINNDERRTVGDGLVEKHPVVVQLISKGGSISESAAEEILHPKPDCVVFDTVGYGFGKLADKLRKQGYAVFGGSAFCDQLELDRPYGSKLMKLHGINTPKTYSFTDYKAAIKFVEETNKTYVYKPSGNQATSMTYVAQGPDDLIGMLEYYQDSNEEFELQEKVEGIEVSTECWFNGKDVISVNHTMEEKTLMEAGVGPKAGCMGDVVWQGSPNSKLYKEGVGKIVPALKKVNYRGPVDLNTIVNKDRLYGLEWTARLGYNAVFSLLELYKGKVNDLFYGVGAGVYKSIGLRSGWGLSVTFAVEPYPMDVEPRLSKDILLQGFNSQNLKHTWFGDVYLRDGRYACAGNGGDLGAITAFGESVREAKRRAYRTLSNLIIPDVMFRRDIGDRVQNDYQQLKTWNWF